ncbi:hypothetical protein [Acidianus brierleyi]|uniref:Uncharacterized protein n=1 Tax=Acidianus brierleyi TaxID=41673 RepID=A0A2U9IFS1_9CREN|nr:hypothetical protein [Acidianus brierleyi]AWR94881.1 hypothetical protein DFR85_10005 [Acidianus brierleyi]
MRLVSQDLENGDSSAIINWAKNTDNLISVIPSVVEVEKNMIKMKFTRMFLFSFESKFSIQPSFIGNGLVEYKLIDEKDNTFKIIFSAEGKKGVKISLSYSGEKEWIVGKGLQKILNEISNGVNKEIPKVQIKESEQDYSENLSKISYLSKLIMKSRLVKSQETSITEGGLIDYIQELISQFSEYPVIYISGSGSSTFRILFVNGTLKGIYVLKEGKDYFGDENILNKLSGNFKIHVYVVISPEILEVIK